MSKKKLFHIDQRYVTVNLTLCIIIYAVVVPFCIYLSIDIFSAVIILWQNMRSSVLS